jgi:glycosyltransferase involved in cell wall biosynthesis
MAERLRRAGPRARLLGYVENLTEFFAALDLYIMPSRSESWGLAALDAMAHGLPVVASDVGGLPEVVEEGATGWLVPPGVPAALADAIATAASDPQRLRQLGRNARQRASQFSSEQTVARVEAVYHRVLAGRCET